MTGLAITAGGKYIGVRGGSTLKVWNLGTGDVSQTVEKIHGFAFSPDGARLATGKQDGQLLLWDLAGGTAPAGFEVVTEFDLCLAFSPDGKQFLASHDDVEGGGIEGTIKAWNVATGEALYTLRGHNQSVTCVAFSPDGKWLATGSRDRTVKLWAVGEEEALATLEGHADVITSLLFSPDGARIVTASEDGTFRLWDRAAGRELITLQASALTAKGASATPRYAAFTPDQRQLIVLTGPDVLAPVVLHSFPWEPSSYPGGPETPIQDRIETYKREYWKDLL